MIQLHQVELGGQGDAIGAISGPSKALPRALRIPEAGEGGELRVAILAPRYSCNLYFILLGNLGPRVERVPIFSDLGCGRALKLYYLVD